MPFKKRLQRIWGFLRFKPFDISIPEGLASERYRRAILTSITSVAAKAVAVLTGFVSVPLTLGYLGPERYGLWMTMSSVVVMMTLADFGLGNGLVNAIAQADGRNDREAAIGAVSSTFFMLLVSAVLFSFTFGGVYSMVPWPRVFNVSSVQAMQESGPAMAVLAACFILNVPLGVVQRVQLGYQEGFLNNLWQIAGNVLGLIALLIVIQFQMGLPWLVLAMSGVPTFVTGLNWLFYFFHQRPWLLPRRSHFRWNIGKSLLGTGMIFMLLWIVNILGTSTDNIIIAQFLGASSVAGYAVVQRLFSLTSLVQMATAPLWPAFSEALARSDHAWAFRTFKHAQMIAMGMTLLICLPLLLFGQIIIRWWAGPEVVPAWSLLIGYTLFRVVSGFAEAAMPVMQTQSYIRHLVLIASLAGISTLALKIVFVPMWQSSGVAWANGLGYALFFTIPVLIIPYQKLRKGMNNIYA